MILQAATRTHERPRFCRPAQQVAVACVALCLGSSSAAGQSVSDPDSNREYRLKAAYLYNLAKFVEWPHEVFKSPTDPIVFAVLGKDPFGDVLEGTFDKKTVGGRPCVVKRFSEPKDVESCHLLFVGLSDRAELALALSTLKGKPIVTVGEAECFTGVGGMIRLYREDNRIHFEINIDSTRAVGIRVSSQLLKLGKVVGDKTISSGK